MYGEGEGNAPHEDQSELEPLHLPGDGAAAAGGCAVMGSAPGVRSEYFAADVSQLFRPFGLLLASPSSE